VEPSPEIREVVIRFFEAVRDGDEEAVSNRISRQSGFERFGSDPDEVWDDGQAAARVWVQQMRELGGYTWHRIDEIRAMTEGTVGWARVRAEFEAARAFTATWPTSRPTWKGTPRADLGVTLAHISRRADVPTNCERWFG
jgi:hypothetical protein